MHYLRLLSLMVLPCTIYSVMIPVRRSQPLPNRLSHPVRIAEQNTPASSVASQALQHDHQADSSTVPFHIHMPTMAPRALNKRNEAPEKSDRLADVVNEKSLKDMSEKLPAVIKFVEDMKLPDDASSIVTPPPPTPASRGVDSGTVNRANENGLVGAVPAVPNDPRVTTPINFPDVSLPGSNNAIPSTVSSNGQAVMNSGGTRSAASGAENGQNSGIAAQAQASGGLVGAVPAVPNDPRAKEPIKFPSVTLPNNAPTQPAQIAGNANGNTPANAPASPIGQSTQSTRNVNSQSATKSSGTVIAPRATNSEHPSTAQIPLHASVASAGSVSSLPQTSAHPPLQAPAAPAECTNSLPQSQAQAQAQSQHLTAAPASSFIAKSTITAAAAGHSVASSHPVAPSHSASGPSVASSHPAASSLSVASGPSVASSHPAASSLSVASGPSVASSHPAASSLSVASGPSKASVTNNFSHITDSPSANASKADTNSVNANQSKPTGASSASVRAAASKTKSTFATVYVPNIPDLKYNETAEALEAQTVLISGTNMSPPVTDGSAKTDKASSENSGNSTPTNNKEPKPDGQPSPASESPSVASSSPRNTDSSNANASKADSNSTNANQSKPAGASSAAPRASASKTKSTFATVYVPNVPGIMYSETAEDLEAQTVLISGTNMSPPVTDGSAKTDKASSEDSGNSTSTTNEESKSDGQASPASASPSESPSSSTSTAPTSSSSSSFSAPPPDDPPKKNGLVGKLKALSSLLKNL